MLCVLLIHWYSYFIYYCDKIIIFVFKKINCSILIEPLFLVFVCPSCIPWRARFWSATLIHSTATTRSGVLMIEPDHVMWSMRSIHIWKGWWLVDRQRHSGRGEVYWGESFPYLEYWGFCGYDVRCSEVPRYGVLCESLLSIFNDDDNTPTVIISLHGIALSAGRGSTIDGIKNRDIWIILKSGGASCWELKEARGMCSGILRKRLIICGRRLTNTQVCKTAASGCVVLLRLWVLRLCRLPSFLPSWYSCTIVQWRDYYMRKKPLLHKGLRCDVFFTFDSCSAAKKEKKVLWPTGTFLIKSILFYYRGNDVLEKAWKSVELSSLR